MRKRKFTSLRMKAERKCGRSRIQMFGSQGRVEAELHIFGNDDTVLVDTPNYKFLEVNAEWKYGNETSHL